jgi:hypothetical protein
LENAPRSPLSGAKPSFAHRANLRRSTRQVNGLVGAVDLRCGYGPAALIVVLLMFISHDSQLPAVRPQIRPVTPVSRPYDGPGRPAVCRSTARRGPELWLSRMRTRVLAFRIIAALLRKAAATSFPHEAAACREKAKALRVKYGL